MSYGGHYKRARQDDYAYLPPQPMYQNPLEAMPPQQYQGGAAWSGQQAPLIGAPLGGPSAAGGPLPADPATAALGTAADGSMPVVKLRGLPFDTEVGDVNRFLDMDTVDVVLMKRAGRFSGEAYVVLPGMAQVEAALAKHHHYMGKRYVEVLPAVREDYYRAAANWIDDPNRAGGYPNSLPPSTPSMSRYGPIPRGARLQQGTLGAPEKNAATGSQGGDKPGPLPATGILRLRGLPFAATQHEVAVWFNELEDLSKPIDATAVHLVLAYDGRPTGSAFVEFSGPADAEVAMGKNKANMGSRYVEIFHSSTQEIELAMGGGI